MSGWSPHGVFLEEVPFCDSSSHPPLYCPLVQRAASSSQVMWGRPAQALGRWRPRAQFGWGLGGRGGWMWVKSLHFSSSGGQRRTPVLIRLNKAAPVKWSPRVDIRVPAMVLAAKPLHPHPPAPRKAGVALPPRPPYGTLPLPLAPWQVAVSQHQV